MTTKCLAWVVLATAWVSVASGREWTDASGLYHTEARLMGWNGVDIWLEKSGGQTIVVPIEKLSAADRMHVLAQLATEDKLHAAPAVNPERSGKSPSESIEASGHIQLTKALVTQEQVGTPVGISQQGQCLKYIYRGCGLNSQLILSSERPAIGTILYCFGGKHRLDGLDYFRLDPKYFVFRVTSPGTSYAFWSFARIPNVCGCYSVWAWDGKWTLRGWMCRECVGSNQTVVTDPYEAELGKVPSKVSPPSGLPVWRP
jgi:hypothetical protein